MLGACSSYVRRFYRSYLGVCPSVENVHSGLNSASYKLHACCYSCFAVTDLGLARKTFANVSSTLSLLVARLGAASTPRLPSPSPAVPLPDWRSPPPFSTPIGPCSPDRLVVVSGGGGGGSGQLCYRLAAVLPDPWSVCFASAHRAFRLHEPESFDNAEDGEPDSQNVETEEEGYAPNFFGEESHLFAY